VDAKCRGPRCVIPEKTLKTLVLGLGNVLMGDEGIGVYVVRKVEKYPLPAGVECLDGGTGAFTLLEPLQSADRIIMIDAAASADAPGTIARTAPKFSRDYPPTLTVHDVGMKDLLDVFYIQGGHHDIVLFAITIDPQQPIRMSLSKEAEQWAAKAVEMVLAEVNA
jgi:hydrogenase maturation protease